MLPWRRISSWNCLFVICLRVDELLAQPAQLQAAEQVGRLVERPVAALERAPDFRRGVVALVADLVDQEVDASCGDQLPMWNFSEKMIRAQRCMRQKSAPTRSSGVSWKPRS